MTKKNKILDSLIRALFFIASVAIMLFFCPREAQYQYQFELGKPWQYDLLTANFDFPVYKDKSTLKEEREDVLNNKVLYFNSNNDAKTEAIKNIHIAFSKLEQQERSSEVKTKESKEFLKNIEHYLSYINNEVYTIYKAGVIDDSEYNTINSLKSNYIVILDENNLGIKINKSTLYSVSKAAKEILKNIPKNLSPEWIEAIHVEKLLVSNYVFNENITEKILDEEYKSVSVTQGMVQRGERIIDRGEIVTEQKYRILNSLKQESMQRNITTREQFWSTLLGQILTLSCLIGFFFTYSYIFRKKYFLSKRYFCITLMLITTYFISTSLIVQFADPDLIYIIPYALVPMLISTFYDTRTALFTHITTILLTAFVVSVPLEFILLQLPAGMMTIYIAKDVTERSQLIKCAVAVFLTYCVLYTSYGLMLEGDWVVADAWMYLWFTINGILLLFAYPFMYVIEKTFRYTTNVTLLELSNTNNKLLRALSEEAPGTFQHVLQVANLSSQIAEKVGGNALLARTGALYHDIGKSVNPAFFTENQHGVNHHDKITPQQSAEIIIDHVTRGVEIAKQNSLPPCIIDFIKTHHGKGMTKYFYNTCVNNNPGKEIDPTPFTYPGPNPTTIEEGVVMICDAIEAASRSLSEYTDESINELVEKIVDGILQSHALDNTPIKLNQIEYIKEILKEKLKNIYHTRVAYPELKQSKNE